MIGTIVLIVINVMSNVTITNQQDYSLVKNTAEAAMYDAIDWASYEGGFHLCYKNTVTDTDGDGKLDITSSNDYKILLDKWGENLAEVKEKQEKAGYICNDEPIYDYKISADVFAESFLRRFAANVNNNKSYKVTIQDVIEYPPKVSVRIDTYSTLNSQASTTLEYSEGDFNIRNQVDAILEDIKVK